MYLQYHPVRELQSFGDTTRIPTLSRQCGVTEHPHRCFKGFSRSLNSCNSAQTCVPSPYKEECCRKVLHGQNHIAKYMSCITAQLKIDNPDGNLQTWDAAVSLLPLRTACLFASIGASEMWRECVCASSSKESFTRAQSEQCGWLLQRADLLLSLPVHTKQERRSELGQNVFGKVVSVQPVTEAMLQQE